MTIQEALNSGKRFKRPVHGSFMYMDGLSIYFNEYETPREYKALVEDILATDWEVEPPKKKLLGADEIREAIKHASSLYYPGIFMIEETLKHLGLEE